LLTDTALKVVDSHIQQQCEVDVQLCYLAGHWAVQAGRSWQG
jgi:hypothetical protein